MRYGVSRSPDFGDYIGGTAVVVRDFKEGPEQGRILCIIPRENLHEAEQIAQKIADAFNTEEPRN